MLKLSLWLVDKNDDDTSGTETRTATFSTAAPGQPGTSISQGIDEATFDQLTVGRSYDFTLTLTPPAAS